MDIIKNFIAEYNIPHTDEAVEWLEFDKRTIPDIVKIISGNLVIHMQTHCLIFFFFFL